MRRYPEGIYRSKVTGIKKAVCIEHVLIEPVVGEVAGEQKRAARHDFAFAARRQLPAVLIANAKCHFRLRRADGLVQGFVWSLRIGGASVTKLGHAQSARNTERKRVDGFAHDRGGERIRRKA